MLITEVVSNLKTFLCSVRVKYGGGSSVVRTTVTAEGLAQARIILMAMYGGESVLSISEVGVMEQQTLSADQLKVKSLQDKKASADQLLKAERARQKVARVQKQMLKAQGERLAASR